MSNRSWTVARCRRRLAGLGAPADYLRGLRRPAEEPPDNVLLFVRRSPRELCGTETRPFFHHRWVLVVPLRGRGRLQLDRRSEALRPGQAALVPPLSLHAYGEVSTRLEWLFVTFDWPGHGAADAGRTGARRLDAEARRHLGVLIDGWRARRPHGGVVAAHTLALIRHLYPPVRGQPETRGTVSELMRRVVEAGDCRRVKEVARRAGCSESHLRARFRKETGISLGRYLRETRLRQAALWLREEGLTVKEAAARCGYPDAFTFSRAFLKVVGVPPSRVGRRAG